MPSLSTSVAGRPHLWVTFPRQNLVYSRYEGNKAAMMKRRVPVFIVASGR